MFVDCLPGYRISTGVHQGYDSATVYCNDDDTWGLVSPCTRTAFTVVKLAFHGADTDTDTDTRLTKHGYSLYVRHTLFPREDPREDIRVGVGVGVVELQLYKMFLFRIKKHLPTASAERNCNR